MFLIFAQYNDYNNDKGCNGAPDWIIDAEKNRIMAYDFVGDNIEEYSFIDIISCTIFDGFQIDFSKIIIE